jgi:hypothetical protein
MIQLDPKTCWVQTYSGKRLNILLPEQSEIDILDIAHALSNMCRFNGHCRDFYSVAQHSILVSILVEPKYKLAALLHDASEAYMADIVSPLKPFLTNYKDIEQNLMKAIYRKVGIEDIHYGQEEINKADLEVLFAEKRDILNDPGIEWGFSAKPMEAKIKKCLTPQEARKEFLLEYFMLTKK